MSQDDHITSEPHADAPAAEIGAERADARAAEFAAAAAARAEQDAARDEHAGQAPPAPDGTASALERPEVQVGLAFAGAFLAARILKRIFD